MLERGRHLQIEDVERIAEIKSARPGRMIEREADSRNVHSPGPAVMSAIEISAVCASTGIRAVLSEILIETVAHGGSVSFMHPLQPEAADAFSDNALAAAGRDERIISAPGMAIFSPAPSPCCWIVRPTSRIAPKSPR